MTEPAAPVTEPLPDPIYLLRYALHLRMRGENAPGGDETWQKWDRLAETYLRALIPTPAGEVHAGARTVPDEAAITLAVEQAIDPDFVQVFYSHEDDEGYRTEEDLTKAVIRSVLAAMADQPTVGQTRATAFESAARIAQQHGGVYAAESIRAHAAHERGENA